MKSDTDSLDLVFESIKKKDKGDYVCKAYFDHGVDKHEVEKRFNLTVFSKLTFSCSLSNVHQMTYGYPLDEVCWDSSLRVQQLEWALCYVPFYSKRGDVHVNDINNWKYKLCILDVY